MVTIIKANILLYKSVLGRKTPFSSGYRPVFSIEGQEMQISGQIILLDRESFTPGETGIVEVRFISKFLNTNFGIGSTFTFSEGTIPLGEGIVKEIL